MNGRIEKSSMILNQTDCEKETNLCDTACRIEKTLIDIDVKLCSIRDKLDGPSPTDCAEGKPANNSLRDALYSCSRKANNVEELVNLIGRSIGL
jgi:hypothetical protein